MYMNNCHIRIYRLIRESLKNEEHQISISTYKTNTSIISVLYTQVVATFISFIIVYIKKVQVKKISEYTLDITHCHFVILPSSIDMSYIMQSCHIRIKIYNR